VEKQDNADVKPQPEPAQVAPQKEVVTLDAKEVPQKLIEIPPIDEDTKRMLSKAGVNWDSVTQAFERVNIWAESVNAQFKIIFEKMPTEKGIADELIKRAEEKQKQFAQQQQQAASSGKEGGGGIGMGDIIKVVDKVMSSESSNPLMNKYMDALITRNMNEMVESTTFDKIMREYFVKKMSKELGEPLMSAGAGAKP
jgi:hypothetical protein